MSLKWANNASTTIAGSITATDTTVALAAGTGILFPPVKAGSGNFFCATFYDQAPKTVYESVHVTDITGDIATISAASPHARGLVGTDDQTTPRAWNAGDIFANLITAGTLDSFVQTSTVPAAPTTELYIGIDISTVPNHIICPTQPVPASLQIGMQFNIKVANTNINVTDTLDYKAAVDLALNGNTAIPAKLTDGSDLNPLDIVAGIEYIFIYNGVNFTAVLQDAVLKPPQTTFYVRSDSTSTWADPPTNSIESNTGFADTPTQAFKTIQGALNTITKRYVATFGIKLKVADGTYTSGIQHNRSYISQVEVEGNDANPQNCILDCRSTTSASYVPGCIPGNCAASWTAGHLVIHGFNLLSNEESIFTEDSGFLWCYNCNLNATVSGYFPVNSTYSGMIHLTGNITYTGGYNWSFIGAQGGIVYMGLAGGKAGTFQGPVACNLYMKGHISFSTAVLQAFYAGCIEVMNEPGALQVTQDYQISGPEYMVSSAGGIAYLNGTGGVFNCSLPGIIADPTGWVI